MRARFFFFDHIPQIWDIYLNVKNCTKSGKHEPKVVKKKTTVHPRSVSPSIDDEMARSSSSSSSFSRRFFKSSSDIANVNDIVMDCSCSPQVAIHRYLFFFCYWPGANESAAINVWRHSSKRRWSIEYELFLAPPQRVIAYMVNTRRDHQSRRRALRRPTLRI